MSITPERAETLVLTVCALRNYLRSKLPNYPNALLDQEDENTHHVTPGDWRRDKTMDGLQKLLGIHRYYWPRDKEKLSATL